jgi:hypothetical protein
MPTRRAALEPLVSHTREVGGAVTSLAIARKELGAGGTAPSA